MINQANFLQSLGWAVLNSLWQLALLWLVYQLITSAFRSARPAAKSMLATSLLIAGFAWFIYTFLVVFSNTGSSEGVAFIGGYENEQVNSWLARTLPAASVIYLLLLFIPLLRFIRNYRYVQVIRNHGLSRPDAEWRLFVSRISERMGIKKPVHIWISEWVTSPVTIGYLKPVILVPMAAINQLSTQQMEAVLLHELSHIRRYDYLLNLILNIIRTILYFNPFAKAFVKIVEAEREKSCDEMVLQFQYDSYEYASALLTLEKVSREQRLLILNATGSGKQLLSRIETIMGVQQKRRVTARQFTTVLTALFCIVSVNALIVLGKAIGATGAGNRSNIVAPALAGISDRTRNLTGFPATSVDQKATPGSMLAKQTNDLSLPAMAVMLTNPAIMNANFNFETEAPEEPVVELGQDEEAIVKEAVESSRKVLESSQWKAIEKNLADVFSRQEKEELKKVLNQEMNKFDWAQWEYKLRQAYDRVNWEQVNSQLNEAISKMRTDSLVKVYNDALVSINLAQKELNQLSITGVPDSDISLRSLADKQRQLQRELNRLKATKVRKTVHL